jgi:hypothetical protein
MSDKKYSFGKNKNNKQVVIVIPTHRPNFSADDEISLAHLNKYLYKYDTFFVIPNGISSKEIELRSYKVKKVDNIYFGTIRKYSNLLLDKKFYEMFINYNYMLVYQLDSLVLSDQLEEWINSGYDYIAAPWFRPIIGYLSYKKGYPSSGGNGGFCLRNIQKCIKILDIVNKSATRTSKSLFIRKFWFILAVLTGKSHKIWLRSPALDYPYYEDGFWALEAPKYLDFKIAPFKIALQFAFERFPRKCFKLNHNKLPFGVHAWRRYDLEFWRKFIDLKGS